MARIIASKNKKNMAKVRKKLESTYINLKRLGMPDEKMLGADALMLTEQLLTDNKAAEALVVADHLVAKFPLIIDVLLLKARALMRMEYLVEASEYINELILKVPGNLGVLVVGAKLHTVLGNSEKSLQLLKRANKINEGNSTILIQMADCYTAIGEKAKAVSLYERVIKKNRSLACDSNELQGHELQGLIGLSTIQGLPIAEQKQLKIALNSKLADADMKSRIAFCLADIAKREKNTEQEIEYLNLANDQLCQTMGHSSNLKNFTQQREKQTALNIRMFDQPQPRWLEGFEVDVNDAPIFILGLPRSGTTLAEQMLGSHSAIGQTGESRAVPIAITRAYQKYQYGFQLEDFPVNFNKMPLVAFKGMVADVVNYQRLLTDKSIYVDKLLHLIDYAGIAANLLPKAKFIHMNRAPMDIFLSCYRGAIPGVPATSVIAQLAVLYIHSKKLIGHWRQLYPERLHIIDYAALVDNPEKIMRGTMEFLELDWEDGILEFHKRKNVVRTLSVDQVRQGIYKTSVNKWLPFKSMLQPAIDVLESYGVDIEGVPYL